MTSLENVLTLGVMQDGATGIPPGVGETQQAPGPGASPGGTPTTPTANPGGMSMIWMILPILFLFIIMTSMGGRKDRKRRNAMLGTLKKRDRVQTQGGIIGVITEIKGDELVLKVDEASNTKIRFARTAIQHILRSTASADTAEEIETESVA